MWGDFTKCYGLLRANNWFDYNSALTSVNFTDCYNIYNVAGFSDYSKLTSINLSGCSGLTTIDTGAFSNCSALECVNFTGCLNLNEIRDEAFLNCTNLSIIFYDNDFDYNQDSFFKSGEDGIIPDFDQILVDGNNL